MIDRFPPSERGRDAAQTQDVIEMAMREQNAIQILESHPTLQDLPLRAFRAIQKKTIALVDEQRRGHIPFRAGRGRRGAKETQFKHD